MQRGGRALGLPPQPCAGREPRDTKQKKTNIMKIIQKIGIASVAFCLMAGFAQAARPDATLQLSSGAVAAGVGISWGHGTLTYKGKQYPVSVSGLSLGKVGITKVTASGEVYNLKKLQDFQGNYTSATADITLAGGRSGVTMKNQNGVLVVVHATSKGVDLTIGASGVDMKLKK
jgi:envelope integrity protein A